MALAKKIAWSPRLLRAESNIDSPEIGWVSLGELHIDSAYQRNVDELRVQRIVENFDPHLVGALLGSRRSGGSIYIIDGQHRLMALRELGHQVALVSVYEGLTPEQEALLFYECNIQRRPPNQWEKFRARLAGRDPKATALAALVEQCGLRAATSSNRSLGSIAAVGALERIYSASDGPALLRFTLTKIKAIWPQDIPAYDGLFILGLATFAHSWSDQVKWARFDDVMSKVPAVDIVRRARQLKIETARGMQPSVYALALRDIYNGRVKNNRIVGAPRSITSGRKTGYERSR